MNSDLKSQFLLDPDVVYLNHGSFGACPRPVYDELQRLQLELEFQPMEFLERKATEKLAAARATLAEYLGCGADEIVYFPNPTTAINMVARSLQLGPGDEILSSDHEYGAMDRTWRFICGKTGATYVRQPVPLPVESADEFMEAFWSGFSPRTRVVFVSHITSPTALIFPVEEICRRAREAGVLTIVDGAHCPSQIPLDLRSIGADFYTGACHKWLCAPKGSSFLYVHPESQHLLEPLVVSWGWEADHPSGSTFVDHHEWQGTRDISPFLAVPTAIAFQSQHDWDLVRRRCHQLARTTRDRIHELTGLEPLCPDSSDWFSQMFAVLLPEVSVEELHLRLYNQYRIEALLFQWNDLPILRVCFQGYNDQHDSDVLLEALGALLPTLKG